jgi:hypothetical protein
MVEKLTQQTTQQSNGDIPQRVPTQKVQKSTKLHGVCCQALGYRKNDIHSVT